VLVSKGTSPELSYELEGPEAPLAAEVRPPGWWRPYEGPSRNPTGYEGDAEVGTYDLGERRSAESGGPTEWTNDSVSSRPEGALGVHGFSYMRNRVRGEGGPADMLPIYENRPEECVHRHPRVSGYERGSEVEGLSELYVVGSGKVGIGVFHPEEGTMDYHLLAQGDALVIGPDEVHAVLATSREFSYSCLQAPSLYHYPFNYTKHQFARVDEVDALLGRHLVGGLASIEEPGVYRLEADARALGVR
jgi:hypothetical protein